ncbi:conjugal transfer protein TraB [Paraburkholderia sp. HD33-4]|uniref:conjugal transfer protein TraB n=1 Tax=Paraburkholderia sp. HD33-4 TaxID=2883242 RepID=UPI001F22E15F|nr:conjugal transfer protein TraB [Paraburkholderia sp. HD33-4]
MAGVAVALLAWYPGRWLAVLILLPAIWSTTCRRWSALSLWAGYYLTGARDIPVVCERFFAGYGDLSASTAFALGVVFWLGQALALAAPWAFLTPRAAEAPRAARALLAIMLVSLPPLGTIGWLSPIYVAGALYPGWQLAGLLLGMCMLATAARIRQSRAALRVGALLIGAAVVAHLDGHRPELPSGWIAVDTSLGRLDQRDYETLHARFVATMQTAQWGFESGAGVVVFPEELVGVWRPAMRYWWRDYLQQLAMSNRTLILGVDLEEEGSISGRPISGEPFLRYTDSAVIVGAGYGRFDSRQPVPVGLWRPWASVSATRGSLMQSYLKIAGRRAAFSICYEDFLWWPHWRLLIDRPDLLVSMSNSWFNADLSLAHIQQQSVYSIAQLTGLPLLRAVNR